MRAQTGQTLIKSGQDYESRVSPHSPPLNGGSSWGQTIPICFERAPQYNPVKYECMLASRGRCCNETQKNGQGVGKTKHNLGGEGRGGVAEQTEGLWWPKLDGSDWERGRALWRGVEEEVVAARLVTCLATPAQKGEHLWHSQTGVSRDLPNRAYRSLKFQCAGSADCKSFSHTCSSSHPARRRAPHFHVLEF